MDAVQVIIWLHVVADPVSYVCIHYEASRMPIIIVTLWSHAYIVIHTCIQLAHLFNHVVHMCMAFTIHTNKESTIYNISRKQWISTCQPACHYLCRHGYSNVVECALLAIVCVYFVSQSICIQPQMVILYKCSGEKY